MSLETLPYLSLLLAVVLIYVPRMFVARGQAQQPEGYDNRHPRAQQAKLTGLAARARGAHDNSFEAFAPFAAGVLACKLAGVDAQTLAVASLGFVGVRAIYLFAYLNDLALVRSAVWSLGFLITLALLVLAMLA
jgi:uncharacterized MAPEG superfamily protein